MAMRVINPLVDPRSERFRRGKHVGETVTQVFNRDREYLDFVCYEARGTNKIVREYLIKRYSELLLSCEKDHRGARDVNNRMVGRSISGSKKRRK